MIQYLILTGDFFWHYDLVYSSKTFALKPKTIFLLVEFYSPWIIFCSNLNEPSKSSCDATSDEFFRFSGQKNRSWKLSVIHLFSFALKWQLRGDTDGWGWGVCVSQLLPCSCGGRWETRRSINSLRAATDCDGSVRSRWYDSASAGAAGTSVCRFIRSSTRTSASARRVY